MAIDPRFIMRVQGQEFVRFAGLLDASHRAGLKSIVTTIVQIPGDANGQLAVVQARIEMESGQVYEATGDASPASVGRMILPHLLRMAETRAIGRAFRWALNVAATMREELPDEEPQPVTTRGAEARARHAPVCEWVGCDVTLNAKEMNTSRRYAAQFGGRCLCEPHARDAARLWKERESEKS